MASKSKTLTDFLTPLQPPSAKRFKQTISSLSATRTSGSDAVADALSDHQKSRIEFQKSLAGAKRNLKICSPKLSDSKGEKDSGYVELEELLVEETWTEVLRGEFEKPYAKSLCKFVEMEISGGAVPVYPPRHLIFNALNSTPFDGVKAVILGQEGNP